MSTLPGERDAVRGVLARLGSAHRLALFCDFDGTLSPFAPRPDLAALPEDTCRVLRGLAALPDVTLGIISSRRLSEVVQLADLGPIHYAGLSGLEMRLANGETRRHPALDECRPALQDVTRTLQPQLERFAGAWIEDKHGALAVHHRNADASLWAALREILRDIVERHRGLLVEANAFTLEVWPRARVDKGDALAAFLENTPPGALVFFAGDDANDGPALRKARDLGGIAVGVGPRAPEAAELRLAHPDALRDLLERVLTQRTRGDSA